MPSIHVCFYITGRDVVVAAKSRRDEVAVVGRRRHRRRNEQQADERQQQRRRNRQHDHHAHFDAHHAEEHRANVPLGIGVRNSPRRESESERGAFRAAAGVQTHRMESSRPSSRHRRDFERSRRR